MTKRQALQECVKVWSWLAKSGGVKFDCPIVDSHDWVNNCPCCDYVCQTYPSWIGRGMRCASNDGQAIGLTARKLCPLGDLWPDGCEDASSPYAHWEDASTKETRRKYARQIASAARAALKKLPKLLKKK